MEKSNAQAQDTPMLWISRKEHIISFHKVEGDDYEQLVFANQNEKLEFVFQTWSSGFRIQ